jgi:drug/metabolite transporter (DMT)-like permease
VTRTRAEAALVFNTLIWGSTFVVVKDALTEVTPLLFLALRFSVATLALLVMFRGTWSNPRKARAAVRGGVVCGVFLFAGYAFQTFGLRLTSAPKSAFLTGLSTAAVPLLAALVYRARLRAAELAGVGLAMTGMGLMTLQGAALSSINPGDILTLACAVAFAAHIVALGHYSPDTSFELLSLTQVGVAAVMALGTFWWAERPAISFRPGVWAAILLTGLLATALAFTIQSWAQQYTTSTRTALIFTLEPLFAWATSYVISGETLSGRGVAGALLILGGVLLVELKPLKPQGHPSK